MTVNRIRLVVLPIIYAYSAVWALIPLLFNWGGYNTEKFGYSCTLDWEKPDEGKV